MDFDHTPTTEICVSASPQHSDVTEVEEDTDDSGRKRVRLGRVRDARITPAMIPALQYHKWAHETAMNIAAQTRNELFAFVLMGVSWYTKDIENLLMDLVMDVVKLVFNGESEDDCGCVQHFDFRLHGPDNDDDEEASKSKYHMFGYHDDTLKLPASMEMEEMRKKVSLHLLMHFVVIEASRKALSAYYNCRHPYHKCRSPFNPSEWDLDMVLWEDLECDEYGNALDIHADDGYECDGDGWPDYFADVLEKMKKPPIEFFDAKKKSVCRLFIGFRDEKGLGGSKYLYKRKNFYLQFSGKTQLWMIDVLNDFMKVMLGKYSEVVIRHDDEKFVSSLVRNDALGVVKVTRKIDKFGTRFVCEHFTSLL